MMSLREQKQGIGAAMVAVTVATALATGCDPSEGGAARAEDVNTTGARVVNVGVSPVERSVFADYVRIVGEVEALYDVTLSAEETGTIVRFLRPKGSWVGEGQTIAKIDDAVLRALLDEARATADLAREEFERRRRLWEEDRIGSEIAYLQSKAAAKAADARYRTLQTRLAKTEIRAPVAGVFDEKFVEMGEMVTPGTRVARVVSTRRVKISGGVPERFGLDIAQGDSARVSFDVLPGRVFVGTIRYVGTTVDPDNRTIPIELVLDNPEGHIKPRMLANVQVERARFDNVIVVPQEVLHRTEDGYQVFVAGERDGAPVAQARPVTVGSAYANRVVIESGLTDGELLIVRGHGLVDDGTFIEIVERGGRS